jgi:hypothetical protein
MANLTKIAMAALVAVVASTSLASAGGLTIKPGAVKLAISAPTNQGWVLPDDPEKACLAIDPQCNPTVDPANFPILKLPKKPTITFPLVPIYLQMAAPGSNRSDPQLAVDCEVRSLAATTDDMFLVNTGSAELPSGTQINYRVSASGDRGGFLLPASLAVGAKIKIPGLLHGAETGAPCVAQIVT